MTVTPRIRTTLALSAVAAAFTALALTGLRCAPQLNLDHPRTLATAPAAPVAEDAEQVRFVVLGDAGKGGQKAAMVAEAVRRVCARDGCDFLMFPGDNLYWDGVAAEDSCDRDDDDCWPEPDETDAAELRALLNRYPEGTPKYLVLGNHDWHPVVTSLARARAQLRWIADQPEVHGSTHFYRFVAGPAAVWALDTQYLRLADKATEHPTLHAWLRDDTWTGRPRPWRIAFGHHPYRSNGRHGNADRPFGAFFEEHLDGRFDLYIAGHDHNLQFFPTATPGTNGVSSALLVSGAAADCREPGRSDNEPPYAPIYQAQRFGFTVVTVTSTSLTVQFYATDANGDIPLERPFEVRRSRDEATWSTRGVPIIDQTAHCE